MWEWKGRRVAVIGLGASNQAVIRYLQKQGARITACDQKTLGELATSLDLPGPETIEFRLGPGYLGDLTAYHAVVLTPGMRKDLPEIAAAREAGVRITGEVELFLERCPAPVIGITGTSGKTTTSTLAAAILRADGRNTHLGGNIGRPLLEEVDRIEAGDWVVLELSSFQLETLGRSPHVAVVTNISPNHLDVHPSMEAYVDAKARILRFQREGDIAVLNLDDPGSRPLWEAARVPVHGFSRRGPVERGAFLARRWICWRPGPGAPVRPVMPAAEIPLPGEHNVENVLAVTAALLPLGVSPAAVRETVRAFTGVPHRLETVGVAGGVRYVNDSVATTPDRTRAALRAIPGPLVLIAGGYDKHLPFDALGMEIARRVDVLLLMGQTAPQIGAAVRAARREGEKPAIFTVPDLAAAVRRAVALARPGWTVLLSPACASYDMFRNFEERGETFRRLVRELAGSGEGGGDGRQEESPAAL